MMPAQDASESLTEAELVWLWDLAKRMQACDDVAAAEALAAEARGELCTRGGAARLATAVAETIVPVLEKLRERERLVSLVMRDPLTGLFNRRHLDEQLSRLVSSAVASGEPMTVAMVDVDSFHDFNERHGHAAGDMALKTLGVVIEGFCCDGDAACRYGGDEFVIMMPGVAADVARTRLDALRTAVGETTIHKEGKKLEPVTVSIGMATVPGDGKDAATVLATADAALFDVKRSGRNHIQAASARPVTSV